MKENGLYFDSRKLPSTKGEYILWLDGMGTGRALSDSIHRAANFVFKLHRSVAAALQNHPGATAYPVMDGMYVAAPTCVGMQSLLSAIFGGLAGEFLEHDEPNEQFLARAGLSYGPTIHGADVPDEAFIHGRGTRHEQKNRDAFARLGLRGVAERLLLSPAMVSAYEVENSAPPFGVYVDDAAIAQSRSEVDIEAHGFWRLWKWWKSDTASRELARLLFPAVAAYLKDAESRSIELRYPFESIVKHRRAVMEYFREFVEAGARTSRDSGTDGSPA